MLGIRTRGRRMVGADKTTELWRPPKAVSFNLDNINKPIKDSMYKIAKGVGKLWSSGYGRRLVFKRLWVQIPEPCTGWKIFIFICSNLFEKDQ